MRKGSLAILSIVIVVVALFSYLAYQSITHNSNTFIEPIGWYEVNIQNATATKHGSTLMISFNLTNQGAKSLTIERFIMQGYNSNDSVTTSGNPPVQDIPGLLLSFNGTTVKNPQNANYFLSSNSSILTELTIPNYSSWVNGTYVAVETVTKEIVSGNPGFAIN
jgi:hypothetical protein